MPKCKLPPVTDLARALRRAAAEKRNPGHWEAVTVLWYPDGFWELSFLSPDWYTCGDPPEGLKVAQAFIRHPLVRSRNLARDIRDSLKEGGGNGGNV